MFDDARHDRRGGRNGGRDDDDGGGVAHVGTESRPHAARVDPAWREIDRELQRVARARGGLDADELLWLARAERVEIHRKLGHATILEYVERVLGHGPRVARERLRVARALETLPGLRAELEAARLSYSAVREVSRVASPSTERRWIDRVAGLTLREIEPKPKPKPGPSPSPGPGPHPGPAPNPRVPTWAPSIRTRIRARSRHPTRANRAARHRRPPATARLVWRRDGGRCRVPGCRSTRHIEVHHIRFRADGIDHAPSNLICLCFAHHAALHDGYLTITGRAPDELTFERIDPLQAPQRRRRQPPPRAEQRGSDEPRATDSE